MCFCDIVIADRFKSCFMHTSEGDAVNVIGFLSPRVITADS